MQIRCTTCTKTIAIAATGVLPPACPHCAGAPVPERLGPFVPLRLVAAGGMGEVYLARHHELGTEVALKLLPALPLDTLAAVRERFAREARLTAKVQHAGVVKVLASDVAGDRPYLVLELVHGTTLRALLDGGPLAVVEAARIAAATADVLAAAHDKGVLHRDIKPDNVMVEPTGAVRVLDFGIARAVQDDAPLTRTGEIVGTPEYMAPEQLLDGPDAIDARTDVHALGVLTYELLTGRSPFRGTNVFQTLKLVESLVPSPASSLRTGVSPLLDAAVVRALQKLPGDRFVSASSFAAAVRDAVPAARLAAAPRPARRRWSWLLLPLAAATGVALAMLAASLRGEPVEHSRDTIEPFERTLAVYQHVHDGRWDEALLLVERPPGPHDEHLREAGEHAFVFSHLAWPLAAGAPPWLAHTDAARRARWLGDAAEPAATAMPPRAALDRMLDGVPCAPPDGGLFLGAHAELLAAHLETPVAAEAHELHDTLADGALARLLRIRLLPPDQRADAFAAYAQRQPLESSEHWLAHMAAHHLAGRTADGTRAAEMAWLSGAGELAVLLDAFLQIAPLPGQGTWRVPHPRTLERLRVRVAGGDHHDAPAGVLMLALLDALGGLEQDTAPLHALPERLRAMAHPWFVAAAKMELDRAPALLLVATALGAVPDYTQPPWFGTNEAMRNRLDAEVKRGR